MLEELLRLIGAGGVVRLEDLSRELKVTQPLLETMLNDLDRMGYLRPLESACAGGCAGCSSGGGLCSVFGGGKVWVLSEKGSRAIDALPAK
jgi:hypothetical protein